MNPFKKKTSFILLLLLILIPFRILAGTQAVFYVASNGNDADPGSISQPFLTLVRAQEAVRAIQSNMTGDIIVYVREGVHTLTSTFSLDSSDSGTNGFNIIYKAYPGETPVISGGTVITDWELYSGSIYRANVGNSLQTRQLYVNGVRAQRARSELNPSGFIVSASGYSLPSTGFYADMAEWKNLRDIEIYCRSYWKSYRLGIGSISGTLIKIKEPCWSYAMVQANWSPQNAEWIENAFELLDSPGEWYLDRSEGYLYYIPKEGEDLVKAIVVAATLETLVRGTGTLDTPIHNIQFDSLVFSYNTWLEPNGDKGYPDAQGGSVYGGTGWWDQVKTPAGVTFSAAKNIQVKNCVFTHMGNAALNFDYGSQNNYIDYNIFTDISGNGINIGGNDNAVDHHPSDLRILTKGNIVSNNLITNIGVEYTGTVGIFYGYTDSTVIRHNTIHDVPYTAISGGWGWGYAETLGTPVAKNNIISSNLIYNIMLKLIDGGGIYTLGSQMGSKVYNNYIYADKQPVAPLYRDNGVAGFTDVNNVVSSINSGVSNWYITNTSAGGYYNPHDNVAYRNYYSSELTLNGTGGTNRVTGNYPVANYEWNDAAIAVMDSAGVGHKDASVPDFSKPVASFTESNIEILKGGSITYVNESFSRAGTLTYNWSFPGGVPATSISKSPKVKYSSKGIFDVRLIVTDASGQDSLIKTNRITVNDSMCVNISQAGFSIKSADSENYGYEASLAIDGNPSTFWHTVWQTNPQPPFPHEIQINLGKTYNVCNLKYLPRNDGYQNAIIKDYEIYLSTDGISWGEKVTSGTMTGEPSEKTIKFPTQTAQYIKLVGLSDALATACASAAEINVGNYAAAPKQSQTISFGILPASKVGDADIQLTATASSGLPVSYTSSDATIASIENGSVHLIKSGIITIKASQTGDINYNAATDVKRQLVISPPTGIDSETMKNTFVIFPNPVGALLNYSSVSKEINIEIVGLTGQKFLIKSITNKGGVSTINVSDLKPGMYFLQFRNENGEMHSVKFVKE